MQQGDIRPTALKLTLVMNPRKPLIIRNKYVTNPILGPNSKPLPKTGNFLADWWRWFANSMRRGVESPASNLVGTFGLWCLALGFVSLLGGASYLALGKTHETYPVFPTPNPTDAGESFAARLVKPLLRSTTAPSSEGQVIQPEQPDNPGIYRDGDQPGAQ